MARRQFDMASNWDDLKVRVTSAVVMTAVGAIGIVAGGIWFQVLVVFCTAVMIWELWMMIDPDRPTPAMLLAVGSAAVLSAYLTQAAPWAMLMFLIVPVIGTIVTRKAQALLFVFALAIPVAGWGLIHFRTDIGLAYLLWLISVVVASDVFGYFAGRTFGGPKFWPKVSPKKTWSGTIAGWVGAAVVGYLFTLFTDAGPVVIVLSVAIGFAGQMGDIAESALKRRMGVKDSSDLIPGHGGFFDRFDALLGAALFLLLVTSVVPMSGATF